MIDSRGLSSYINILELEFMCTTMMHASIHIWTPNQSFDVDYNDEHIKLYLNSKSIFVYGYIIHDLIVN